MATSDNILIGAYNRLDEATLSGGAWVSTLPRANLATPEITDVARTTDATLASTQWACDFGQARAIRLAAIDNHNLGLTARWRVTLGSTAGASDVWDSGWVNVWRMTFNNEALEWESPSWWAGTASDEYLRAPFPALIVLPDWYTARYAKVEIDDTGNADGYVQIGRAYIGNAWQPRINASLGLKHGLKEFSSYSTGGTGRRSFDAQRRIQTTDLVFEHLSPSEADVVHEMMRYHGIVGQVVYCPYPSDPGANQRYGFLANFDELQPIEYARLISRGLPMRLIQVAA